MTKNSVRHARYPGNHTSYLIWLSFMVYLCKMIITLGSFSFCQNFDFSGCYGDKRAKNCPKWQKVLSVALHIQGTIHHIIVTYDAHLWNDNIFRRFFHFSKFWFFGSIVGWKGKKWSRMTKNAVCRAPYLRNHII